MESSSAWSTNRRQPARDPGDRPPPHRCPASWRRASAQRAARGRPSWSRVRAAAHRLVRTGLARRTAVRAQPIGYLRNSGCGAGPRRGGRCRRAGRGPGPRRADASRRRDWLPPSAAAYVGAGSGAAAQQRSAHRVLADVSPAIHTRLRGPGTEPKPRPDRTNSSRRTWYAQLTRAAPGRGMPPHLPRWSGLRCSWATLH